MPITSICGACGTDLTLASGTVTHPSDGRLVICGLTGHTAFALADPAQVLRLQEQLNAVRAACVGVVTELAAHYAQEGTPVEVRTKNGSWVDALDLVAIIATATGETDVARTD